MLAFNRGTLDADQVTNGLDFLFVANRCRNSARRSLAVCAVKNSRN